MQHRYDGFWFPSSVRDRIITADTRYDHLHFEDGGLVDVAGDGTVSVRWPRLDLADWKRVVARLQENRQRAKGDGWGERLPQAVHQMRDTWAARGNPLRQSALEVLARCTGHSAGMLDFALRLFALVSVDDLRRAASCRLTHAARREFVSLAGLEGQVRFFEDRVWRRLVDGLLLQLEGYRKRPWLLPQRPTDLVLGYAAGNVPGAGLLLILLSLAAAAGAGIGPPVIVVKNSRREPLFTPLALAVLEAIDPTLVDTTLVTLWDYGDAALQEYLISQADLVIAAASDETIEQIDQVLKRVSGPARPIRFHRHGHKVSFSTIGRECLEVGRHEPESGAPVMEVVALLASLDVALWNQQGCLSSRVHFVEQGSGQGYHSPEAYGSQVVESLRTLNAWLPKGILKKRQIHNLFDKYQATAAGGAVQVLSGYDDDFLVVLDRRSLAPGQFREVVNDCQGRTVVVVPVDDVMEAPGRYLKQVQRKHLQSMSVALGDLDNPGIDARLLRYAEALGAAGVTGIRTVGRGAFPQLAYSWDGWLPLDLTTERQGGHFTALEFDRTWAQIYETYRLTTQRSCASNRQVDGTQINADFHR